MQAIAEIRLTDGKFVHRRMDLAFLPVEGMCFDFSLEGESGDPLERRWASFQVQDVSWVENGGVIYFLLEISEDDEEDPTQKDFSFFIWRMGEVSLWHK